MPSRPCFVPWPGSPSHTVESLDCDGKGNVIIELSVGVQKQMAALARMNRLTGGA
jgi:hypothetical protein